MSADEVEVTFVDNAPDDVTTTLQTVIGPTIGLNPAGDLAPVDGTTRRTLTVRMRSDLRFAYVFTRRSATGGIHRVPDPANPPPRFSTCSVERYSGASVLALPDAEPLPWLEEAEASPTPDVAPVVLASDVLGSERRIWVSLPPGAPGDLGAPGDFGELEDAGPLAVVVHLDGTLEHSAPSVRDALVRAGVIRPCVVVLVENPADQRNAELLCNEMFSRFLVEELVPWLRENHPVSHDPADVALAGESFGGLCAAWTSLHHADTFGNAILQSPSCGYHPDQRWGTGAGELLRRTPVPTLMADFLAADRAPLRVFHDVGELEGSITASRWLDQVLRLKGYDTEYREYAGGHDYAWWRGLLADALLFCFPAGPA